MGVMVSHFLEGVKLFWLVDGGSVRKQQAFNNVEPHCFWFLIADFVEEYIGLYWF